MLINDKILGPKRHLEDKNRTCELRDGSHDFTRLHERATFRDVNMGIG